MTVLPDSLSDSLPDSLRYPIGRFDAPEAVTPADLSRWITDLEVLPTRLASAIAGLTEAQLDTPYRPGGWTVRQVVHHVADSHTNAYVRFKLALTEEAPTIRPYDEGAWADLGDVRAFPVALSVAFLSLLHQRWCTLLRSLERSALERTYVHPQSGVTSLAFALGQYAWHGRHHLAHVTRLAEREGWSPPASPRAFT